MADPVLKGDLGSVRIGPGWLLTGETFDTLKCLGLTQDGITLSVDTSTESIEWDQIDDPLEYISSRECRVTANLGEVTKANREEVILGGYVVYDPAFETEDEATKDKEALFVMGSASGRDPLEFAKILVIHPKKNPWSDRSEDIVMEKAYPITNLNEVWSKKDPRLMEASFKAVVHTGPTGVERSFVIGDYKKIKPLLDTPTP